MLVLAAKPAMKPFRGASLVFCRMNTNRSGGCTIWGNDRLNVWFTSWRDVTVNTFKRQLSLRACFELYQISTGIDTEFKWEMNAKQKLNICLFLFSAKFFSLLKLFSHCYAMNTNYCTRCSLAERCQNSTVHCCGTCVCKFATNRWLLLFSLLLLWEFLLIRLLQNLLRLLVKHA